MQQARGWAEGPCLSRLETSLAPRVAALARQVDAGLQLREIVTLQESVEKQRGPEGVGGLVIGSILLGAVVFAAAGLYALMAVAVSRRTREIGIRIALGASRRRVLASVFARAGRQLGGNRPRPCDRFDLFLGTSEIARRRLEGLTQFPRTHVLVKRQTAASF